MNKDSFVIFKKIDKFYEEWDRKDSNSNNSKSTKK